MQEIAGEQLPIDPDRRLRRFQQPDDAAQVMGEIGEIAVQQGDEASLGTIAFGLTREPSGQERGCRAKSEAIR